MTACFIDYVFFFGPGGQIGLLWEGIRRRWRKGAIETDPMENCGPDVINPEIAAWPTCERAEASTMPQPAANLVPYVVQERVPVAQNSLACYKDPARERGHQLRCDPSPLSLQAGHVPNVQVVFVLSRHSRRFGSEEREQEPMSEDQLTQWGVLSIARSAAALVSTKSTDTGFTARNSNKLLKQR